VQSIPGLRLRSAISGMRTTLNKEGDPVVPVDQSRHLASFPQVPGMQIHVNPEKLTYAVIDPLYKDEEMCKRITRWLRTQTGFRTGEQVGGLPPKQGVLDVHSMKTLCRELWHMIKNGHAKKANGSGPLPEMEDIEALPGKFLLNPGLRTQTTQPRYEEDWPAWLEQLTKAGG
jgi:hypothetical protein